MEIDFTTDAGKLQTALAKLRLARSASGAECPDLKPYHAQLVLDNDPQAMQSAVNMTAQCLCDGPPSSCPPDVAAQLPDEARASAQSILAESDGLAQRTLGAMQNLIQHMAQLPGERRIGLISNGFENQAQQDRLSEIIDRAIRGNVVINAMTGYGLKAYVPGGDASESSRGENPDIEKSSDDADAQVVQEATESTGGIFIHDTNDYDGGFERIGGVTETSYLLGFTPQNMKFDGSFHKIKAIVTEHSNWTLEARRGYYATKPAVPAVSAEMQEENSFRSILAAPDPDQQIKLALDFLANHPASRFAGPVSNRLAEAYYSKRDWNDFYAAAATTLAKNPDDVDILVLKGWVIAHLSDPNDSGATAKLNEAEIDLKHAIEIIHALPKPAGLTDEQFAAYQTSEILRAHSGLGLVYFRFREYGLSVVELQQATLGVASPDPTDLWALGIDLQQLKRYADAADAFDKCSQAPGNLQDPCKQLIHQAQSSEAKVRQSNWAPPDVDAPLVSISTVQACSLPDVLTHAGERAQELVNNLQRFAAEETIQYQQLNSFGMLSGTETANYDYLVTFQQEPGAFVVDESRQISAGGKGLTGGPRDHGLTALALIFHPYYQGDYDMRCEGMADWNGTPAWVIHFVQRKDKPSRTQGIDTPQREVSLKLKGRAWIAEDSYQVLHLETNLAEPVLLLGLSVNDVSISYAPVDFRAQNVQLWLPQNAETFTEIGNGRAVVKHTFSDFVLFSVQSNQTIGKPAQP